MSFKSTCLLPLVVLISLVTTGCKDKPAVKGCSEAAGVVACPLVVNGEDCTVIDTPAETADVRCPSENEAMKCSSDYDNTSGNICRVKVDGTECVAVLPDGGKAPRDYKDFVTCPKGKK